MKLNLGSGGRPLENYTNVDINPRAPKVDVVYNLDDYPWPFKGETVDEVIMNQCLEHLVDHSRAMKEIHRILKKGGIAKISVPHFTWQFAFHDLTHRQFFGYNTFFYYTGRGAILILSFPHARLN